MSDLCSDVLDASKLRSNKVNLKSEWCHIGEIISTQSRSFAFRAQSLGITLEYHVDSDIPEVLTDDLRWRQCLTNLLVNSCRFTPSGGRIDIHFKMLDDATIPSNFTKLQLSVVDTGIGMDRLTDGHV